MLTPESIAAVLLAERLPLIAFIASITRDFHLAEDVFQEVSVKAVGRAAEYGSEAHVLNWARLAGRNRAIDVMRSRDGRYTGLTEDILGTLAEEWPTTSQSEGMTRALDYCLEQITPNNRELLRLRYFERRPCGEIAAHLGRKLETIYQALARIHKVLAECVRLQMEGRRVRE